MAWGERTRKVTVQPGQQCALCRDPIVAGDAGPLTVCPRCRTVFHGDCVRELGDRSCATPGCAGPPRVEPAPAPPRPQVHLADGEEGTAHGHPLLNLLLGGGVAAALLLVVPAGLVAGGADVRRAAAVRREAGAPGGPVLTRGQVESVDPVGFTLARGGERVWVDASEAQGVDLSRRVDPSGAVRVRPHDPVVVVGRATPSGLKAALVTPPDGHQAGDLERRGTSDQLLGAACSLPGLLLLGWVALRAWRLRDVESDGR